MTKTKTYKEDELPEKFAQRIGLKFNDPMLLCRALTHRSFLNEHPDAIEDNERLEFLGDAILDFIVGAWLYTNFPKCRKGIDKIPGSAGSYRTISRIRETNRTGAGVASG